MKFELICTDCNKPTVKLIKDPQMSHGEMEDCKFFALCTNCGNKEELPYTMVWDVNKPGLFLIVDDDENKIWRIKESLTKLGHKFIHVKSYNSAMRAIFKIEGNHKFDGIILDMGFAQFDDDPNRGHKPDKGLFVLHEMMHHDVEIPTAIFSGSRYDTSDYAFVKDYWMSDCTSIDERLEKFVIDCLNNRKEND